jgi:hypothetical protein
MKRSTKIGLLSLVFISLSACMAVNQVTQTPQNDELNKAEATARMALTMTAWPTSNDLLTITITPMVPTDEPCAYMWASHSAPGVDVYLSSAITSAGLEDLSAHAQYFGEDCVTSSGTVVSSGVMYTDLYFEAAVSNINNDEALGVILGQITDLIAAIPEGVLTGSFNGYLGVHFISADGERNVWIELESIMEYCRQGLDGADLMNAVEQ